MKAIRQANTPIARALWTLFDALREDVEVINEPRRSEVGAPDFLFYDRNGVPVACCEAKDATVDLANLKGYSADQFQRYAKAYPNLLYTNALDFPFLSRRGAGPGHFDWRRPDGPATDPRGLRRT